jgi:hypothetical protein
VNRPGTTTGATRHLRRDPNFDAKSSEVEKSDHGLLYLSAGYRRVLRGDAGAHKGVRAIMTLSPGVLLSVSVLVYLGVAPFKPEWF